MFDLYIELGAEDFNGHFEIDDGIVVFDRWSSEDYAFFLFCVRNGVGVEDLRKDDARRLFDEHYFGCFKGPGSFLSTVLYPAFQPPNVAVERLRKRWPDNALGSPQDEVDRLVDDEIISVVSFDKHELSGLKNPEFVAGQLFVFWMF